MKLNLQFSVKIAKANVYLLVQSYCHKNRSSLLRMSVSLCIVAQKIWVSLMENKSNIGSFSTEVFFSENGRCVATHKFITLLVLKPCAALQSSHHNPLRMLAWESAAITVTWPRIFLFFPDFFRFINQTRQFHSIVGEPAQIIATGHNSQCGHHASSCWAFRDDVLHTSLGTSPCLTPCRLSIIPTKSAHYPLSPDTVC